MPGLRLDLMGSWFGFIEDIHTFGGDPSGDCRDRLSKC